MSLFHLYGIIIGLRQLSKPFMPSSPFLLPHWATLGRAPLLGYKDSKSLLSTASYQHLKMGAEASIHTPPISMRRKRRGKLRTQNSGRIIHPLWTSLRSLMRL